MSRWCSYSSVQIWLSGCRSVNGHHKAAAAEGNCSMSVFLCARCRSSNSTAPAAASAAWAARRTSSTAQHAAAATRARWRFGAHRPLTSRFFVPLNVPVRCMQSLHATPRTNSMHLMDKMAEVACAIAAAAACKQSRLLSQLLARLASRPGTLWQMQGKALSCIAPGRCAEAACVCTHVAEQPRVRGEQHAPELPGVLRVPVRQRAADRGAALRAYHPQ